MIFAILRSDYLEFIKKASTDATYQLSSTYTYCAAKLLHLFVWTTKKGTESVQITQKQIREKYLLGEHGKDAIAASTGLLEELEVLIKDTNDRRTNERNGQNKTYRYSLNYQKLCELLGFVPEDIEDSIPDDEFEECDSETDSSSGDCSPPYEDLSNTSPSTSSTTTVSPVEENVEEVKRAIADSLFMQDSSDTDSPPQPHLTGQDKLSAPSDELKKPSGNFNSSSIEEITDDSSTPLPKRKLVFPCEKQLLLHRVDLYDEDLQRVAKKFKRNLSNAVDAWLEWANQNVIHKPTLSLICAIKDGWKPEKPTRRAEIKPPPPGVLEQLKQKFRSVLEIPWQGGWCWGVGNGNHGGSVLPWWDAIAQLGGEP